MEDWIILGIIASLCFGASAVVGKVALSKEYLGVPVGIAAVFSLIGIAVVFGMFYLIVPKVAEAPLTNLGILAALGIGLLWATGQVAIYYALSKGAEVSRLTPIFNTNTLVAIFLAMILLHELPNAGDAVRVVIGAIMIITGAIMVII
ncbi:MAG: EamA family transporter [Candidatus Altiarchaeota archaeon]|nr:EamA family transporter [Candidatus Altiarchaeota archaeon]